MSYPSETETLKQFAVRCTMSDQHWRQMTGSGTGRQTNASIFKRDPKFLEIKSRACTHLGGIQLTALECRELKMTSGITQRMGRMCFFNTEHYIFYIWLPRKPTLHGGKKHERHNLRSERVLVAVLPWAQTSTAQGKQWFSVDIGWPSLQVSKSCVLTALAPFSLSISLLSTYGVLPGEQMPRFRGTCFPGGES